MANTCYDNFFLSNEIEDQYQSHLDLQKFCTVDNNLTQDSQVQGHRWHREADDGQRQHQDH